MSITVLRENRTIQIIVQPVDLATRLKEMKLERQQQMLQEEKLRVNQDYGPYRTSLE